MLVFGAKNARLWVSGRRAQDLGKEGAALVLVPIAVAKECLSKGELEESISESFGELLNVFAQLFAKPGAPRVFLQSIHPPTEPLPDELSTLMEKPSARLDLSVDVSEYGGGLLSVLTL